MKHKSIILFVFFLAIFSLTYFTINKKIEINDQNSNIIDDKVIKYMNDNIKDLITKPNDFNDFYLLFDEYKLSTKNLEEVFKYFDNNNYEYKIKQIYPYLNPLYKDLLTSINKISFNGSNLKDGITSFSNQYINELRRHNFDIEISKVGASGIAVRMILVNTSNISMYNFLSSYKNIKYNLAGAGIFKKL